MSYKLQGTEYGLGNRVCPKRVVERGLGRGNKQEDNGREFFRPDNKLFHRLSPKQDKLNRNLYPKTSQRHC